MRADFERWMAELAALEALAPLDPAGLDRLAALAERLGSIAVEGGAIPDDHDPGAGVKGRALIEAFRLGAVALPADAGADVAAEVAAFAARPLGPRLEADLVRWAAARSSEVETAAAEIEELRKSARIWRRRLAVLDTMKQLLDESVS